jgi:hypothetical protein
MSMCPAYSFENRETGESYDLTMPYEDLEKYLQEHAEVYQVYRVNIVDPAGIGIAKPPVDFQKHVLGRIKSSVPHSTAIGDKRWSIPKEI